MQISPNFYLSEFLQSRSAASVGIDNTPTQAIINNLEKLAMMMEQVRTLLGGFPIQITSGYRCQALNVYVGGSKTSQHMKGQAADFVCPKFGSPLEICQTIVASKIKFDQLILEFSRSADGGWTHLSWAHRPRRSILTIDERGTLQGLK